MAANRHELGVAVGRKVQHSTSAVVLPEVQTSGCRECGGLSPVVTASSLSRAGSKAGEGGEI